jgi:hypothetical protein
MRREENYYLNKWYAVGTKKTSASIITIAVLSLLLLSCKSIQYVPVEKVVTEYKTNTVHDSVYLEVLKHDSVIVEKLGDTVVISKWHTLYKDKLKEVIRIDTLIKIDSVQVPYPVERKLTKWEQTKMNVGGVSIGICIAFVAIMIIVFLVKAYRKT